MGNQRTMCRSKGVSTVCELLTRGPPVFTYNTFMRPRWAGINPLLFYLSIFILVLFLTQIVLNSDLIYVFGYYEPYYWADVP